MAGDVGQPFLHDPEGRRFHRGIEAFTQTGMVVVHPHTGLLRIALEERVQRRQQPKLIQGGRPQVEGQPPDRLDEFLDDGARLLELGPGRAPRRRRIPTRT